MPCLCLVHVLSRKATAVLCVRGVAARQIMQWSCVRDVSSKMGPLRGGGEGSLLFMLPASQLLQCQLNGDWDWHMHCREHEQRGG
jgi:hypothetical protein